MDKMRSAYGQALQMAPFLLCMGAYFIIMAPFYCVMGPFLTAVHDLRHYVHARRPVWTLGNVNDATLT